VLTRDRELLKRRGITHGCYVHALRSELQLREVFARLDLHRSARPFTRCLNCNAPLRPLAAELAAPRVPPRVRAHYDRFVTCDGLRPHPLGRQPLAPHAHAARGASGRCRRAN
jgi:uncharacterized protein with PIN domain